MLNRTLRTALALGLLTSSAATFSKDCIIVPAVSLCGVPIKAPQAAFEKAFGEPDGRINMGKDRVGLLYGINFVVIYWHGRIWEVQNWTRPETGPTDWIGYVGFGRKDRETRVHFPRWNPWEEPSPKDKDARRDMPTVDGDEYSDVKKIRGGTAFFLFDAQDTHKRERSRVTYIKVNFDGEPPAP